jgi:uncharacterized protein YPO0396
MRELLRLRELLGLSLEELRAWVDAEAARADLRERWHTGDPRDDEERTRILDAAREHIDTQLSVVRNRRAALEELEDELVEKRRRLRTLLAELSEGVPADA